MPYHRRHDKTYLHRLVAAQALGKPLPPKAVIHHVDGNTRNNTPSNLVICENQAFHNLLHMRARVKQRGGDPNTQRWCRYCDLLLAREAFYRTGTKCIACHSSYYKAKAARRAA